MREIQTMNAVRPTQLMLMGAGGIFLGLMEMGVAMLGLIWLGDADLEPEVITDWFSMNLKVHILLGGAVLLCGFGMALMREWGRRGMVLHALLSGLWAFSFALISTTWVVATWEKGWEQTPDGGAVNEAGVAAFLIGSGCLVWLVGAISIIWILSRPQTREAMNRRDQGLSRASST